MINTVFIKLFFVFILICGCKGSDKDYVLADCPLQKKIEIPNPNIDGVNVFLEVSGSMSGFMPSTANSTDFQKLVPDLINRFNRDLKNTNFFSLTQSPNLINEIDISQAGANIAYGKFKMGSSSTLPVMLDSVFSKTRKNNVSILITDAIYTPPDSKLRDQAITDISNIMTKVVRAKYAISCFAMKSEFDRTTSPYYLFAIGESQNLELIKEKIKSSFSALHSNLTNKGFKEVHFGFSPLTPFYSIIPYVENTGAFEPKDCPESGGAFLVMENVEIEEDPAFWLGIDLSKLPPYAQDKLYLKENLSVVGSGGLRVSKSENILTRTEILSKTTDLTDKTMIEKATHFIRLKLLEVPEPSSEISISLKKITPSWISADSHSDSPNAEKLREKTFGLENIIKGVADAYKINEKDYFFENLRIIASKK